MIVTREEIKMTKKSFFGHVRFPENRKIKNKRSWFGSKILFQSLSSMIKHTPHMALIWVHRQIDLHLYNAGEILKSKTTILDRNGDMLTIDQVMGFVSRFFEMCSQLRVEESQPKPLFQDVPCDDWVVEEVIDSGSVYEKEPQTLPVVKADSPVLLPIKKREPNPPPPRKRKRVITDSDDDDDDPNYTEQNVVTRLDEESQGSPKKQRTDAAIYSREDNSNDEEYHTSAMIPKGGGNNPVDREVEKQRLLAMFPGKNKASRLKFYIDIPDMFKLGSIKEGDVIKYKHISTTVDKDGLLGPDKSPRLSDWWKAEDKRLPPNKKLENSYYEGDVTVNGRNYLHIKKDLFEQVFGYTYKIR